MSITKSLYILIATILLVICPTQADSKPSLEEKYRIGVILPLSGASASVGKQIQEAINLAYQTSPENIRSKIELQYEDDQFQPSKSVSAYHFLKDSKGINAVIVVGSGIGAAVAPLAERDGILMIALGASDKTFVAGKKYGFIHWVSPEIEAKKMVDEIVTRNYQRIAMISHQQQGVKAFNEAFLAELGKRNLINRVVLKEEFALDARDFSTFVAKARSESVDGLYVALFPGSLSAFAKKAKESGLKAQIFGAESFEDQNEVAASDGALLGAWYVNSSSADNQFIKTFQKSYGAYPGWASPNGFDALNLISSSVDLNGKDNMKIAARLKALKNYSGATGSYSATGDNRFDLQAAVKIITPNGFEDLVRPAAH